MSFFLYGTGLAVAGVGAWVMSRPKPEPFHVTNVKPIDMKVCGMNAFPIFQFIFRNLPDSTRQNFAVKMGAPKPNEVKDRLARLGVVFAFSASFINSLINIIDMIIKVCRPVMHSPPKETSMLVKSLGSCFCSRYFLLRFDCLGESPYTITEIVPGKMWKVGYDTANLMLANKQAKDQSCFFGMDPREPEYKGRVLAAAEQHGEKAVEVAHQDMQKAVDAFAKESLTDKELMELSSWTLNSFIVKLKSGGLLLYAPVNIRNETGFADWVDSLGNKLGAQL